MSWFSLRSSVYPLIPGGGLFLLIVGLFMALGGWLPRYRKALLAAGFFLASLCVGPFAAHLQGHYPAPSRIQGWALVAAIVLEVIVIAAVVRHLKSRGERPMTLAILITVGGHFFLMLPAFGPVIAIPGVACVLNARRAQHEPRYELRAVWLVDAAIKILSGLLMLGLTALPA